MKSIAVGALSEEVEKLLSGYADEIADGTDEAARKAADQCVKDIKSAASSKFQSHSAKKPYAKQWTKTQTGKERGKAGYTVYCKTPGLPHLLENGHAKVNGGRVAGRPHIAPAAEKAVQDFQDAVEEVVRNASG